VEGGAGAYRTPRLRIDRLRGLQRRAGLEERPARGEEANEHKISAWGRPHFQAGAPRGRRRTGKTNGGHSLAPIGGFIFRHLALVCGDVRAVRSRTSSFCFQNLWVGWYRNFKTSIPSIDQCEKVSRWRWHALSTSSERGSLSNSDTSVTRQLGGRTPLRLAAAPPSKWSPQARLCTSQSCRSGTVYLGHPFG